MKAKVYPLTNMINELNVPFSPFCLHLEIILASLSKGTSVIKNLISNNEIDVTISWCESLGANIKRNNDRLIIKGINNSLGYSNALFDAKDSLTTALMMTPILCSIPQPFGIKGSDRVMEELLKLEPIFKALGVDVYEEESMIRFEDQIEAMEYEIDGSSNIDFVAGLLICQAMIEGTSILRLRAPIHYEKTYVLVLKLLKKFSIDVKHLNTVSYETIGPQSIKACNIDSEMDNLITSYYLLLTSKVNQEIKSLKINGYSFKKELDDYKLLATFIDSVVTPKSKVIYKNVFLPKRFENNEAEVLTENSLPSLMLLGYIRNSKFTIKNVRFNKENESNQFEIMKRVFNKINVNVHVDDNEITIIRKPLERKTQVDCENDQYVAMALVMLGLFSTHPITINHVECINNYRSSFIDDLKSFGAKIELIHN